MEIVEKLKKILKSRKSNPDLEQVEGIYIGRPKSKKKNKRKKKIRSKR